MHTFAAIAVCGSLVLLSSQSDAGGEAGVAKATPAPAPTAHLIVDPPSIQVVGSTEGGNATYKGGVSVTSDADVISVPVASALKEQGGGSREIPVTSVRFDSGNPTTFSKNTPKLIGVSVETNIPRGRFCGSVRLSSLTPLEHSDIPLCVTLAPKPSLATLPSALNFRLTRCATC